MLFQRIATAPPGARGSSGAPRLAEGARILSGPDLPVQAEAADRPHDAPSIDEEVRRRGRHPGEAEAFHVLKHCCATHLLSKGFGVERVQDWIGHANIQSTMEYAKVTNARRDDMAQQLKETWR